MVVLKNFVNIFYIPELRKKLFFTLGILIVYRLGSHIPVIGVDVNALQQLIDRAKGLGGLFSYLDMFSGGALNRCTLFALGISPYITASIMMQMLGMTIPYLEQLLKEGEYGRKIINQYTRYLAFGVSIMQSIAFAIFLERNNLVLDPGWGFRLIFVLSLTVGGMFVMWLGEQISLFGLGNGSSMLVFAGIVARFPHDVNNTIYQVREGFMDPMVAIFVLISFIVLSACVVFMERGERKVPVQYTRRMVGQRMYSAQSSYIPFKINPANVMPVILATAFLQFPLFVITMLSEKYEIFKTLAQAMSTSGVLFNVLQTALIILFAYVYTAIAVNPEELAENMKKSGGFIPGIRPGKKTAEFVNYILTRLGLVGALYLSVLALMPNIIYNLIQFHYTLSGTALLIVVGVGLDIAAQIESYLIEHRYEGFLSTGRLKGRLAR
ncbi:MAG TPA: preprotein translocase subunit SecY [Candidatus Limnocylindria bacterium]|nr:preprotein translocase subunit SecY [Candidatus Limnocylindria bacterium]